MKPGLEKKELVAMFMESPLYFELLVRERLELLRDHTRRFSRRNPLTGVARLVNSPPEAPGANPATVARPGGADAHRGAKIIVGYFPPKRPVRT